MTSHVPYAEAGLVIASVAGMLNILAMLDVFGWSERLWFERGADETKAEPAAAADAPNPEPRPAAEGKASA